MLLHLVDDGEYRFMFPDTDKFVENWETASTNTTQENRVQHDLESVFDWTLMCGTLLMDRSLAIFR